MKRLSEKEIKEHLSNSGLKMWYEELSVFNPIDYDLFILDLHKRMDNFKDEIPYLLDMISIGKIDGCSYIGECSCFIGTVLRAAGYNSSERTRDIIFNERILKKGLLNNSTSYFFNYELNTITDSSSPLEMFFSLINVNDTPKNNIYSRIAFQLISDYYKVMTSGFKSKVKFELA